MQTDDQRPLAGMRVIDLGWITAGAGTSSILADMGADVVKVEGPGSPDPFRIWEGATPGTDWWNHCPFFAFTNRNKRSLCLDLKSEAGRAAMLRLLAAADVVVENYRRGVMASFGLDPAMLRKRFPRLVIASISSQGETGPDRHMVSYGSTLEATGGLAALTGPESATPVRDAAAVIAAPEFAAGSAVSYAPDGSPAKGIPFRYANRPLAVMSSCHALGADNAEVLREAGFTKREIVQLVDAGVLATAPRRTEALR